MSILDSLQVEDTHMRRPFTFQTPFAQLESAPTGATDIRGFGDQTEYKARLQVVTTFWANRAQYPTAMESAKRLLVREMYRDLMPHVDRLEAAVAYGDREAAYLHLSALRSAMEP